MAVSRDDEICSYWVSKQGKSYQKSKSVQKLKDKENKGEKRKQKQEQRFKSQAIPKNAKLNQAIFISLTCKISS